jgi:hypothetical protein
MNIWIQVFTLIDRGFLSLFLDCFRVVALAWRMHYKRGGMSSHAHVNAGSANPSFWKKKWKFKIHFLEISWNVLKLAIVQPPNGGFDSGVQTVFCLFVWYYIFLLSNPIFCLHFFAAIAISSLWVPLWWDPSRHMVLHTDNKLNTYLKVSYVFVWSVYQVLISVKSMRILLL